MRRCLNRAPDIKCRGSGGRLALPAGSARGRARSHARSAHPASAAECARGKAASHPRWEINLLSKLKLEHVKCRTEHQPNRLVRVIAFAWMLLLGSWLLAPPAVIAQSQPPDLATYTGWVREAFAA